MFKRETAPLLKSLFVSTYEKQFSRYKRQSVFHMGHEQISAALAVPSCGIWALLWESAKKRKTVKGGQGVARTFES